MKIIARLIGAYLNFLSTFFPKSAGKMAFTVFCTPFAAKIKAHQDAYLSTARQRCMIFESQQIQLYEWGNGPETILLIHGWQSNAFRWKGMIESIDKDKYTILAMDAPAHGKSAGKILNVPIYSRLIAQVMKETGPIHTLLAHSIGCFASMHMFSENRAIRPGKVVFMASPGNAEEFVTFFRRIIAANDKTERLMRAYFKEYTGHDVSYFDIENYAPLIMTPGLIVHDTEDKETGVDHARRLHKLWSNSELITTTGLGHKLKDDDLKKQIMTYIDRSEMPRVAFRKSQKEAV